MRYYPDGAVDFYVEFPNLWERYCRYPPTKRWVYGKTQPTTYINYWRDLEGRWKPVITDQDLYFAKWIGYSRIKETACLPLLYSMGERYIKLEQAQPSGFRCALFPMSLPEVQVVEKQRKAKEKAAQKAEKKVKKEVVEKLPSKQKAAKKADKKAKNKGEKQP